jgi:hypothetical protein
VWLLGNLFRTEKRLWRALECAWEIFDITTDVMVSSTENYGIARGAIEVPRISDHDRRGPTATQVSQRSQAAMFELRQSAHLKQRMFEVCSSLGSHRH